MRILFQIAKTELKTLFYSPIAWIILTVFAVQVGYSFCGLFDGILSRQLLGYWNFGLSRALFVSLNPEGTLQLVQNYLFLYIPLLTMGIMHHEHQTGSLSLLYSSPIASWQIIVGKYLALLVVALAFVLVLFCQGVYAYLVVEHFDVVYFLVALLGVFLLAATYAAIGLFLACVIRYPIAAAIATMALLLLLGYVGEWWQDVPVVSQIVYWLSVKNRLTPVITGLLCSEDVLYFVIVSLLFLGLSITYIRFSRRTVSPLRRALSYGALVLVAVVAGWLTCQPRLMAYFDATRMKENSLLPAHQDIMKRLDGPLKITTYANLMSRRGNITPTSILGDKKHTLAQYVRFKPEIETEYVFYYNDPKVKNAYTLRQMARKAAIQNDQDFSKYLSPKQLAERIDLSGEDFELVRVIERGDGRRVTLRIFDDPGVLPSESEWMAAFKRLAMPLPRVGFVTGHGERSIGSSQNRDVSFMARQNNYRGALTNQGFDVVEKHLATDSLSDVQILMILDSQTPFDGSELQALQRYLERGGNACLMTDVASAEAMRPLLQLVGTDVSPVAVTQQHAEEKPELLLTQIGTDAARLDSSFYWMRRSEETVLMSQALPLESHAGEYAHTPLVVTTDSTWLNGQLAADSLVLTTAATRKIGDREQRIIVAGDCDWLSNGELLSQRPGIRSSNANLIRQMFSWLSYGEVPIDSGRKIGPDGHLTVNDSEWSLYTRILFCGVIPCLLLAAGLVILYRRKSK